MATETVVTAKEFGKRIGLKHLEVIRRIRRGDIQAQKLGWFWVIPVAEVDRVKEQKWFKKSTQRIEPESA